MTCCAADAAVAVHLQPEGVATFAAALASPATGVVIAIAIALHNVRGFYWQAHAQINYCSCGCSGAGRRSTLVATLTCCCYSQSPSSSCFHGMHS